MSRTQSSRIPTTQSEQPLPQSEYPPDCHARRAFISNFTGSAGTAVVTKDAALLWTDGRYFLQATQQLSPEWTLMRMGTESCPDIPEWLAENLPAGARVGVDPFLLTVDGARNLEKQLSGAGCVMVPLGDGNLVDAVWGDARPAEPQVVLYDGALCTCTYTYVHTYIHTHVYTHIYTCTHTYIHILTFIHTFIHTLIHTYTHIYTHIHTYTHIYTPRLHCGYTLSNGQARVLLQNCQTYANKPRVWVLVLCWPLCLVCWVCVL